MCDRVVREIAVKRITTGWYIPCATGLWSYEYAKTKSGVPRPADYTSRFCASLLRNGLGIKMVVFSRSPLRTPCSPQSADGSQASTGPYSGPRNSAVVSGVKPGNDPAGPVFNPSCIKVLYFGEVSGMIFATSSWPGHAFYDNAILRFLRTKLSLIKCTLGC